MTAAPIPLAGPGPPPGRSVSGMISTLIRRIQASCPDAQIIPVKAAGSSRRR